MIMEKRNKVVLRITKNSVKRMNSTSDATMVVYAPFQPIVPNMGYCCPLCPFSTRHRESARSHPRTCRAVNAPIICPVPSCGKPLRGKRSLKKHLRANIHVPSTHIFSDADPDILFPDFPSSGHTFDFVLMDVPLKYAHDCVPYRTLTIEELAVLPVNRICANDCWICAWTSGTRIDDMLHLLAHWGFRFTTILTVWIKTYEDGTTECGLGHHTRASSEMVLLAKKGNPHVSKIRKSRDVKQELRAHNPERHSGKPPEFFQMLDRLYHTHRLRKIELFARTCQPGWKAWGDECPFVT